MSDIPLPRAHEGPRRVRRNAIVTFPARTPVDHDRAAGMLPCTRCGRMSYCLPCDECCRAVDGERRASDRIEPRPPLALGAGGSDAPAQITPGHERRPGDTFAGAVADSLPSDRNVPGINGGSAPLSVEAIKRYRRAAVPLSADSAKRLRDAAAVTPPHDDWQFEHRAPSPATPPAGIGQALHASVLLGIEAELRKLATAIGKLADTLRSDTNEAA